MPFKLTLFLSIAAAISKDRIMSRWHSTSGRSALGAIAAECLASLGKPFPADRFGLHRKPTALLIGESQSLSAELVALGPVLLL